MARQHFFHLFTEQKGGNGKTISKYKNNHHQHHDAHNHHDHQTQLLAQLRTAPVQDEAAVKKKIMET